MPSQRATFGVPTRIQPRLVTSYGNLPLSFEANQGQTGSQVKFLSRGRGYGLFLTGSEAVLELQDSGFGIQDSGRETKGQESGVRSQEIGDEFRRSRGLSSLQGTTDHGQRTNPLIQNPKSKFENRSVRLRLVGAKPDAEVIGREELPGKVNYFIGNDPKKWRTNVPTYAKVRYHDVYPGVDLEYYGNQGGQLEYDFIVAPGADPSAIALQVGAVREPPLRIDGDGDLVILASGGEVRFRKPRVYQEQSTVDSPPSTVQNETRTPKVANRQSTNVHRQLREGRFVLEARNRIRFALGPYDHARPLVIDPVLLYSTYLGASGDSVNGIAVDSSGNAYVIGAASAADIPTVNAYQTTGTIFVTKFNPSGTALIYSTYFGGSGSDTGLAIAVDSAGSAYLTGQTCSSDFPTVFPLQSKLKAGCDPFVTKFNPTGTSLVYSTYLGGSSGDDTGTAIAVDSSGDAYLTGSAQSLDFPTANPVQPNLNGSQNAFVTEVNAAGSALVYSTYLGGSGQDEGVGIGVDSSGNAYVTGSTTSTDFPTVNPLQQSKGPGFFYAFVTKLNAAGSALVYSTYLGGGEDQGGGIAVDSSGNAYLTGNTTSPFFPTVNPIQPYNGESLIGYDAFVAKLNPAGSALVYSTYLGGYGGEICRGSKGYSIAIDSAGLAYVAGWTCTTDFPTVNAIQASDNDTNYPKYGAPDTGFVACLNAAGSALAYSTFLGGTASAQANAIAVDSSGNALVGGWSEAGFPTVNPVQTNSSMGAFVAKISPPPALLLSPATGLNFGNVLVGTTSPLESVTLSLVANAPLSLSNITSSGDFALATTATSCPYSGGTLAGTATCTVDITFTPTVTGARSGTVTITYSGTGSPATIALSGAGNVSAASLLPVNLNFGNQDEGSTSSPQVVTLTNPNTIPLTVSTVTTSSGWTESNNCMPAVAADSTCAINVSFQPAAYGPQTGTLTVTDYANNSPQTVTLSGTGLTPILNLSATSLTFPAQAVSTQSAPQTITLSNSGNEALTPLSISVSGDFGQTNTCSGSVAIGAKCTISVTFNPTASGTRSGTLTLTDNASNSPQTVTLSGTGLGPGVGLSATSLTFPSQTVSTQSGPQTITLTNTGNAALTPLKIARSGPFAETNTCPASLAGDASCTVSATFSPLGAGSQSGTITVTDNAPNSPQTIALSGTGVDFAMSSSTTNQTVSAGQTANYSLTLAPQAGFNQTVNLTCTGAPSESTCTLTPNTVTLNGTASTTVAVAVSTTAPSLVPPHGRFLPPGFTGLGRTFWLCALLWLASAAALAGPRKCRAAWLLCGSLLIVMLWCACGGGGTTTPPPSNAGTPAGTYSVEVTATDASISTLAHTIKLTLTVD